MALPDLTAEELKHVQDAVDHEAQRIKIAAKILPLPLDVITPGSTSISSDIIFQDDKDSSLKIEESATTTFYQITVQFKLSDFQYQQSSQKNAITLATRATNILSQAEDILIFQGTSGESNPIFGKLVNFKQKAKQSNGPTPGLLQLEPPIAKDQIIQVPLTDEPSALDPKQNRYGENTFAAVAEGYTRLQDRGHYGPYALVLHDRIYADTHAPLKTTLIMPADRLKPFVTFKDINMDNVMFYGTGTLPVLTEKAKPTPTGILVSLGGNTMDLVINTPPKVTQLPYESGFYPFQVTEQFALRLKDPTAVIRFEFQPK